MLGPLLSVGTFKEKERERERKKRGNPDQYKDPASPFFFSLGWCTAALLIPQLRTNHTGDLGNCMWGEEEEVYCTNGATRTGSVQRPP